MAELILTGSTESPYNGVIEDAVAYIISVNIHRDPSPTQKSAVVELAFYDDINAFTAFKSPFKRSSYTFTVGGEHPYEDVFIPTQQNPNPIATVFSYIQSLPEFSGWTTVENPII